MSISTLQRSCSPSVTNAIARRSDCCRKSTRVRKSRRCGAWTAPQGSSATERSCSRGRSNHEFWGSNAWVELAGHAAARAPRSCATCTRGAATDWVEAGRRRTYAVVPACDRALLDAWFRLDFGAQHAYGIREIPDVPWPANVRRATPDDIDALVAIAPRLQEHQGRHARLLRSPAPGRRRSPSRHRQRARLRPQRQSRVRARRPHRRQLHGLPS